jgi:hypothetical protein
MKKDGRSVQDAPVRTSREFRKLQASVHRYLDDSGSWAIDVQSAIEELSRLARDLDRREQVVLQKEDALVLREMQLDCIIAKLAEG